MHFVCCCLDNHFGPIYLGLGFLLTGSLYSTNSAVNLASIGADRNALMCLTPLTLCCRSSDTGTSALGSWRYPDRSLVLSRSNGDSISRTRGPSQLFFIVLTTLCLLLEYIHVKYLILM